jgi:DNA-binding CsgD family transcriptional regulator
MLKKIVLFCLIVLSLGGFAQNKISSNQVEDAFQLIFQNPSAAFEKLKVLEKQTKTQNDSLHSIVLGHLGVYYAVKSDLTAAGHYFDKSITTAVKGSKTQANAIKNKAIVYKKNGQIEQSLELLEKALTIAKNKKYKDTEAIIYGEIGSCYSSQEDFENALNYMIQSIDLWEKITPVDLKKIAIEKQKLANLYFKMNNGNYALQIYKEIIPIFRTQGDLYNLYLCQINEANIYIHLDNPTKANALLNEALVQLRKFDNKELILFAKERKAKALELLKKNDLAIENYKNAFDYGLQHKQIRTVYTFIEMGNLFLAQNRINDLSQYIELSELPNFQRLLELTTTEDQKRFYELLVDFYTAQNASPEKISSYKKMRDEKAELLQAKYDLYKVREKQAEYRMTIAEKETTIASQKIAIQRIKIFILYGLGFFLILIGIVLYSRFKYKQKLLKLDLKKSELEKKMAQQETIKEKELSAIRLQKIKAQEQELLTQTLQKVESDKMLLQVMSDLENEITPQKLKTIKAIQNGGSNYWKSVLNKFEKINPDFNQTLMKANPQLTKGERDFCSFVKLNLSNKEIAHLLQISPESVITKKYRILKKLNLPKEIDFQLWLSEMG